MVDNQKSDQKNYLLTAIKKKKNDTEDKARRKSWKLVTQDFSRRPLQIGKTKKKPIARDLTPAGRGKNRTESK